MIVDSFGYWVEDHARRRASVRPRRRFWLVDESGLVIPNPPVLWDIESDPILAGTKLIAEAWDAAGLYQVGSFVGDRLEGVERTLPRRLSAASFRGEAGVTGRFADRLIGKSVALRPQAP
jgi:glycogen operon protein